MLPLESTAIFSSDGKNVVPDTVIGVEKVAPPSLDWLKKTGLANPPPFTNSLQTTSMLPPASTTTCGICVWSFDTWTGAEKVAPPSLDRLKKTGLFVEQGTSKQPDHTRLRLPTASSAREGLNPPPAGWPTETSMGIEKEFPPSVERVKKISFGLPTKLAEPVHARLILPFPSSARDGASAPPGLFETLRGLEKVRPPSVERLNMMLAADVGSTH